MANENQLPEVKGVRSAIEFLKSVGARLHSTKPISGPGIKVNEMPDGRQLVFDGDAGGTPLIVAAIRNGEAGYFIANAKAGFTPFP